MYKYCLSILFVICLLACPAFLAAKTLHAILVADTIHDISGITQPDLKRWQKELKLIAKHAQLILREKSFSGLEFQKEKVVDYLQQLEVESEDAVIFIFSGHGYTTQYKNSAWPFIVFELYKQGIDLKWVADTIRNKNPQFTLVLSDCCNNYLERGFSNSSKHICINLSLISPCYEGYHQLFSRAKGHVMVTSCSPGQFSYGSRFGGLYTQCFFTSLNKEIAEKTPSWKNLLQRANSYIRHIQKPICEISKKEY